VDGRDFLDALGDHGSTCTALSGAKKTHDWSVEQIEDLFCATHKVKTQQVAKNWGQRCGDIEVSSYLGNTSGPVPLVLDLRIAHERWEVALTLVLMGNCIAGADDAKISSK
jgi:hypothetical protein